MWGGGGGGACLASVSVSKTQKLLGYQNNAGVDDDGENNLTSAMWLKIFTLVSDNGQGTTDWINESDTPDIWPRQKLSRLEDEDAKSQWTSRKKFARKFSTKGKPNLNHLQMNLLYKLWINIVLWNERSGTINVTYLLDSQFIAYKQLTIDLFLPRGTPSTDNHRVLIYVELAARSEATREVTLTSFVLNWINWMQRLRLCYSIMSFSEEIFHFHCMHGCTWIISLE